MKRLASSILTALLLFSLVACDPADSITADTEGSEQGSNYIENTESNTYQQINESKYHDIPEEYHDIIDAFVKIVNLSRYEGYVHRKDINDNDYPQITSTQIDHIFNSTLESWSCGPDGYFLGYATKDVNGDGIDELFIADRYFTIYSMFYIVNGEVISIDFTDPRPQSSPSVAIDADGNFYTSGGEKGECCWYEISRLGSDGKFYGTIFGHYDMTGFGDTEVYNYYHQTTPENPETNKMRISDEEYRNLVDSFEKTLNSLDTHNCERYHNFHVNENSGFTFYQVITKDMRK